jgi:hypothetical protein
LPFHSVIQQICFGDRFYFILFYFSHAFCGIYSYNCRHTDRQTDSLNWRFNLICCDYIGRLWKRKYKKCVWVRENLKGRFKSLKEIECDMYLWVIELILFLRTALVHRVLLIKYNVTLLTFCTSYQIFFRLRFLIIFFLHHFSVI